MSPTDEELAAAAKRGNEEAFAALVVAHQRKTFGLALQMLRDPEDAADAAQETFLRCYTSLHRYDPQQSFGAWLYRIAYNHCLDILRRRRRTPPTVPEGRVGGAVVETVPDGAPGVEEQAERNLTEEDVIAALDRLPEEQRHILALRYTLDLAYRDIAQILGVPESTVTMRLHHARRALRELMNGEEPADGSS